MTYGLTDARALLRESGEYFREIKDKEALAWILEEVAGVALGEHRPERAVRLWAAADKLRETLDAPLAPVAEAVRDRCYAVARAELGQSVWETAWAEGRAMSLDESLDYALGADTRTGPVPS